MRLLPAVLLLSLAACGEEVPIEAPAPVAPLPPPKPASEASPKEPEEAYYYNPAGKRDPFQGFLTRAAGGQDDIPPDAPPLQRWDVDRFVLKGVIWDTVVPR